MPGTTLFSTLARCSDNTQISTTVFDSSARPPNARGAVRFDETKEQFLDGGAHTFNLESGGFTAIMRIKFSETHNFHERIFDFGSYENSNNIVFYRYYN